MLRTLRLKSCVYFRHAFGVPWAMAIPAGPLALFHVVVQGSCTLASDDGVLELSAGDVALFPSGRPHELSCGESVAVPAMEVMERIRDGATPFPAVDSTTTLICGHFELDREFHHPLWSSLPDRIVVTRNEASYLAWIESSVAAIIRETGLEQPGSSLISERLAEVLLIMLLRAHLDRQRPEVGFLTAVRDSQLAAALGQIHNHPEAELTIDELARLAHMSRTSFATKFRQTLGITTRKYVSSWRMQCAARMLRETNVSLSRVSRRVGYGSKAAFSRAFKQHFGITPGSARAS